MSETPGPFTRYARLYDYPLFVEDEGGRLDAITQALLTSGDHTPPEPRDPSYTPYDLVRLWALNLDAAEQAELLVLMTLGLAHIAGKGFPWRHPDAILVEDSGWASAIEPLLAHYFADNQAQLFALTKQLTKAFSLLAHDFGQDLFEDLTTIVSPEALTVLEQVTAQEKGRILHSTLVDGGWQYQAGDFFHVSGGTVPALGRVDQVGLQGTSAARNFAEHTRVTRYHLIHFGSGYTASSVVGTDALNGKGHGLTLRLDAVGHLNPLTGTEVPRVVLEGSLVTHPIVRTPLDFGGAFVTSGSFVLGLSVTADFFNASDWLNLCTFTVPIPDTGFHFIQTGDGGGSCLYDFSPLIVLGHDGSIVLELDPDTPRHLRVVGTVKQFHTISCTADFWVVDTLEQVSNTGSLVISVMGV